ncbi:hypothetical protein D9757_012194 [Collybiopsis confluens]|uniref:Uncharacterized protein n=1 Tax=Collybiopsis confluens TaxID=2823264 RepID=A0A8H5FTF7_9AGAR|nr:hypothetical protein D9757_012194 [Collybiopsis confluens]
MGTNPTPLKMTPLRIAGIIILFVAFFFDFLVSISLPTIRTLEIAQVTIPIANQTAGSNQVTAELEIRTSCDAGRIVLMRMEYMHAALLAMATQVRLYLGKTRRSARQVS